MEVLVALSGQQVIRNVKAPVADSLDRWLGIVDNLTSRIHYVLPGSGLSAPGRAFFGLPKPPLLAKLPEWLWLCTSRNLFCKEPPPAGVT
jgi:hypothetical protein